MKLKSREEFGKGVLCHHVNDDVEGIYTGGININNLRFADDTAVIADLQHKDEHIKNKSNGCKQTGKCKTNQTS